MKIRKEDFTIACVIERMPLSYYTGKRWGEELNDACLYTIAQAQAKLKELLEENPMAKIRCVIQDKNFNYYDENSFVYDLFKAKFYSVEEAKATLKTLLP